MARKNVALRKRLRVLASKLEPLRASIPEPKDWDDIDINAVPVSLPDDLEDSAEFELQFLERLADDVSQDLREATSYVGAVTRSAFYFTVVDPGDYLAQVFNHAECWPARHAPGSTKANGENLELALVRGFTPYALIRSRSGDTDKYNPPWQEDEWFLEVRSLRPGATEPAVIEAANAYLFALVGMLNDVPLHLQRQRRVPIEDANKKGIGDEIAASVVTLPSAVGAPDAGSGYGDICALYLAALAADDPELQVFLAHKVFEFAQPTVLRMNAHKEIRARLSDPGIARPTAWFIHELEELVKRHQRKSDNAADALKAVVLECCDPVMLARTAPSSLKALKRTRSATDAENRANALSEFSRRLGATRDAFAHAKSTYLTRGGECPPEEIADFARCALMGAAQVVRWLASVPEASRVVRPTTESPPC